MYQSIIIDDLDVITNYCIIGSKVLHFINSMPVYISLADKALKESIISQLQWHPGKRRHFIYNSIVMIYDIIYQKFYRIRPNIYGV